MSYALDAEAFISEVKKYPQIWNMTGEGSKKGSRKGDAWEAVARVFIPDLETMSEADKFEVYRKLHGKWRNIRDAYVRNLKRGEGKRKYMYAKQLAFLDAIYKQEEPSHEGSSSEEEARKPAKMMRHIEVYASPPDQFSEDDASTIDNLKRRRLNNTENIEFVSTVGQNDSNYLAEDADRSFFDSVLPAVREFDMDQKLEFRGEVLKLIKRIRSTPYMHVKIDQGLHYNE
ncbi:uncharacterized protein LOC121728350 [Aricia agestis]|uniref:uncharacterized protein LOC121728350 n=1 Tax=Aricia agestis TaxID=91739 RepID=UPI001C201BCD|nr:uncharacterized protein LOC121728350 [Aricia agestis]